jgi:hypothetical protein
MSLSKERRNSDIRIRELITDGLEHVEEYIWALTSHSERHPGGSDFCTDVLNEKASPGSLDGILAHQA